MTSFITDEIRATVHDLEVKRGSRRGMATKLHNRITKAISEGPDRINAASLQELATQLSTAIDLHNALQAQLEEFYENFRGLRSETRGADDTSLLDTHVEWKSVVANVLQELPLRRQAVSLLADIEAALASPMPDSSFYRNSVDKLHTRRVSVIDSFTEFYHVIPDLKSICDDVINKMARLFTMTAAACREAAPAAISPVSFNPTSPVSTPVSDRNALNVELPTYDGDPFKWANFRTMFVRTVEKRARGHSAFEVKGLLIKSMKHPDGLKILHNLPSDDLPLDKLLDKLESLYGAADVRAPLITRKILSVTSCSLSAADMDFLYDNFLLPYNKFCALMGDSLGSFLAMLASNLMSPECRRKWLRHRTPDTPPHMDNLLKFIEAQKKELRGHDYLSASGPYLPSVPARPSSPRLERPRPPPAKRPPPPEDRTTLSCVR